jgi:inner membrane protein
MENRTTFTAWLRHAHLPRVLLLSGLVLLLGIPASMVQSLVRERSASRDQALADITGAWGGVQNIVGPRLVIPIVEHEPVKDADGRVTIRERRRNAVFLPELLSAEGSIDSATRHRGIYQVPAYRARLRISGRFAAPDFASFGTVAAADVLWEQAQLVLLVSDPRAIQRHTVEAWSGAQLAFLPGAGVLGENGVGTGIHAPLGAVIGHGAPAAFSLEIELNGSQSLALAPLSKETTLRVTSNWPHPSFQGPWLPAEREISPQGFTAAWTVPYLGRNYPQQWIADAQTEDRVRQSLFGVSFKAPVDAYAMSERSVKYAALFLTFTFGTLWLFETVVGLRIHSVQYLLVGAAMVMFYLLELSLAEHLGFPSAYAIASALVTALVSAYAYTLLRQLRRSAVITGVFAALYGYLYLLLQAQDHALLAGSIGLFLALAVVMYLTRRLDWYALGAPDTATSSPPLRTAQ